MFLGENDKIKGAYFFWGFGHGYKQKVATKKRLQVFLWNLTMVRRNEKATSFFSWNLVMAKRRRKKKIKL
jgi:hypothetical protein